MSYLGGKFTTTHHFNRADGGEPNLWDELVTTYWEVSSALDNPNRCSESWDFRSTIAFEMVSKGEVINTGTVSADAFQIARSVLQKYHNSFCGWDGYNRQDAQFGSGVINATPVVKTE